MQRPVYIIDKYTKIVLTVIAVCLVFLCLRLPIKPAELQARNRPEIIDVNIYSAGDKLVNEYNGLPVEVTNPF